MVNNFTESSTSQNMKTNFEKNWSRLELELMAKLTDYGLAVKKCMKEKIGMLFNCVL